VARELLMWLKGNVQILSYGREGRIAMICARVVLVSGYIDLHVFSVLYIAFCSTYIMDILLPTSLCIHIEVVRW